MLGALRPRPPPGALGAKSQAVREAFQEAGPTLVAFSGGVDSTVLAALAYEALGEGMLAVTADSETIFPGEVDEARAIASQRGWRHLIVRRSELRDPAFASNPADRCFFCKDDLYEMLNEVAAARGLCAVADGTNASDMGGPRPGYRAVKRRGVLSPLLDAGLSKPEVREIARGLGLANAEKPALACLSSRFPHGQLITIEGLDRVARAEAAVRRALGVELVRVRDLSGVARVEVASNRVAEAAVRRGELTRALLDLGFRDVLIDPAGYREGGADAPAATYASEAR
jgi:pyridinium-3,5-biscarboxylic acid mononucleotide sulfurtransferase